MISDSKGKLALALFPEQSSSKERTSKANNALFTPKWPYFPSEMMIRLYAIPLRHKTLSRTCTFKAKPEVYYIKYVVIVIYLYILLCLTRFKTNVFCFTNNNEYN